MKLTIALSVLLLTLFSGCSTSALIATNKVLPPVYVENNATHEVKREIKISLFRLNNYTDTPRAGMRAANIIEGILLAKEYKLSNHFFKKTPSLKKARKISKKDGSKYFMYGGVSEWRYKTGIDGEPAVSLQLSLYKTKNGKLVWSATGADSNWGNSSIGTTAQKLIIDMMEEN